MTPIRAYLLIFVPALLWPGLLMADEWSDRAAEILGDAEVTGGLVVHIGCGDGRLTAALGAREGYVVHGLDADPGNVSAAREHQRSRGLYGKVAVDRLVGRRLPYADDLASLIVAEGSHGIPSPELMRVLRPGGVAYVRRGGRWTTSVKPWPEEIDEWTHFLHDAGGNAVADDARVGPPRHMQWLAEPLWARNHHTLASISAAGSSSSISLAAITRATTGSGACASTA